MATLDELIAQLTGALGGRPLFGGTGGNSVFGNAFFGPLNPSQRSLLPGTQVPQSFNDPANFINMLALGGITPASSGTVGSFTPQFAFDPINGQFQGSNPNYDQAAQFLRLFNLAGPQIPVGGGSAPGAPGPPPPPGGSPGGIPEQPAPPKGGGGPPNLGGGDEPGAGGPRGGGPGSSPFYPFEPFDPFGGGNPAGPVGTPPFNPGSNVPNILSLLFPGVFGPEGSIHNDPGLFPGLMGSFGPVPDQPLGSRPSPFPDPGLGDENAARIRQTIDNYLRELTSTLPGSLRPADQVLGNLMQSMPGFVADPSLFQAGVLSNFAPNPFSQALGGQGFPGQIQQAGQNILGGLPGQILGNAWMGLNHNLMNGLPGQQGIINQMGTAQGLGQQLTHGGGNFVDIMNQIGNQGLPGAQQIFGNIGGLQGAIGGMLDPSLPTGGNIGPVNFLNSIFAHGPPGQNMDISGRGGLEGLQGFLTNLGRGSLDQAHQALMGAAGPNAVDQRLYQLAQGLGGPGSAGGGFSPIDPGQIPGLNVPQVQAPGVQTPQFDPQQVAQTPKIQTPQIQQQAGYHLGNLIKGGGLSPEFVQAQTQTVLDPLQDQLLGRLNDMGAGIVNLGTSGSTAEALGNLAEDFGANLTSQGFQNLGNFLGQSVGLGGQMFGQRAQNVGNLVRQRELNAQLGQQGGLANLNAQLQMAQLDPQLQMQAQLANQRAGLTGGQFDIGNMLGILQGNQRLGQQAAQFGSGQGLRELDLLRSIQGQGFGQELGLSNALAGLGGQGVGGAQGLFGSIMNNALAPVGAFGNLLGSLNQNSLGGFNALTGQTLNTARTGADIFNMLGQQGLGNFQGLSSSVLPWLQTGMQAPGAAVQPLQALQNLAFQPQILQQQQIGQGMNQLFQGLGAAQGFLGGQQNFGLGLAGLPADLMRTLLAGDIQRSIANENRQASYGGLLGSILGGLFGGG